MNDRGQTLVAFVIIVPVFILLLAFVVDTGYFLMEYTKLESTTKTILKTTYQNKEKEDYQKIVSSLYEKNNIPTDNLKINVEEDVSINNEYVLESIFGKIIGLTHYDLKIKMTVYLQDDKLIIKKE